MWTQEPENKKPHIVPQHITMWTNRGSTRRVVINEAEQKLADGWVVAEKGTKLGQYNPIYDRGDKKTRPAPQIPMEKNESVIQEDYLRAIEV